MSSTFHLIITSVSGAKFDGQAISATLPGTGGEITILAHHEPIVTTLKAGTITVRAQGGDSTTFLIENGVLECSGARATIIL